MRTTLLFIAALAGLTIAASPNASAARSAVATPAPAAALADVQTVQYYGERFEEAQYREDWRRREWRHREWERRHRHEEWRHAQEYRHGW